MHGDRDLAGSTGGAQEPPGGILVDVAHLTDDADAATHELPAHRLQIHHQVAMHLAEADHHARRQRVQDELRRRPRLHPGGAGDGLRADDRRDGHIREPCQALRRRGKAQKSDPRPPLPGLGERSLDEGRRGGRRDAEHEVLRTDRERLDGCAAGRFVVLDPFQARLEGGCPPGDHASHEVRVRAEGGGAFRRIEDSEPSARARPDVDQPTPDADPPFNLVDQASDRLGLAGHGRRDTSILGVDQLDDLPGRGSIDPRRGGVAGFGQTRVLPQIDSSFAGR